MNDPLLSSLAAAVAAAPQDMELRAVYATRLASAEQIPAAIGQALIVLSRDPAHPQMSELVERLSGAAAASSSAPGDDGDGVDWSRHEAEIGPLDVTLPDEAVPSLFAERPKVTLADVGGLDAVKRRIRQSFLDPLANPDIARAFGSRVRGGLLLSGPPGCGKTFLARAMAGELGAGFMSVALTDVLTMWLGESEANLHDVFVKARLARPMVLFFDEVDALGGRRSAQVSGSGMRPLVNQFLTELDGIGSDNEGLFILAATNHPWDVDEALLRPGRFDRVILVPPPDQQARDGILRLNMRGRPVGEIPPA